MEPCKYRMNIAFRALTGKLFYPGHMCMKMMYLPFKLYDTLNSLILF